MIRILIADDHTVLREALVTTLRGSGDCVVVAEAGDGISAIEQAHAVKPDVAVVDSFPGPYPEKGVRLCCEILPPEDRLGTMLAKCEEYHAWGVPFCWVIDPVKRAAWEYHSGGEPVRASDKLQAGAIAIGLVELFAALDEE